MELQLLIEGENKAINVKVNGMSTTCEILVQEVKKQLKSQYITIQQCKLGQQKTLDLSKPINEYFDPTITFCFKVIKLLYFSVKVNDKIVLENGFPEGVTIANIISAINKEGYNVQQYTFSLCDEKGKKILLDIPGDAQQTNRKISFQEYQQPFYLFINCRNTDWESRIIQKQQEINPIQEQLQSLQQNVKKIALNVEELKNQFNQIEEIKQLVLSIQEQNNQIIQSNIQNQNLYQEILKKMEVEKQSQIEKHHQFSQQIKMKTCDQPKLNQQFQNQKLLTYSDGVKPKDFQHNANQQPGQNQLSSSNYQKSSSSFINQQSQLGFQNFPTQNDKKQ